MDRAKYKIKNSAFEGVPVGVSLVQKVYFGVKTMCKKFHKVCLLGCDLAHGPKGQNLWGHGGAGQGKGQNL